MKPTISVVIVTYNSEAYISQCIQSVLKQHNPNLEVIVIDNHSTDRTIQILENEFSTSITFISLKKNVGFAEANNVAVEKAGGEFLFLLNPDTELSDNFFSPLIQAMKKNTQIGACQPLVYLMNNRNVINLTGKVPQFLGFDWIRDFQEKESPKEGKILSISGSGVLLRSLMIKEIGLFDPAYFMYYEDSDLSWRMNLAGYDCVFVPQSIMFHDYKLVPNGRSQTSKNKLFYAERNRVLNVLKNYSFKSLMLILPLFFVFELLLIFFACISGFGKEKIRTYLSIWKLRAHIMQARKQVQVLRKRSDRNIVSKFSGPILFKPFLNIIVEYIVNPFISAYWTVARIFI